MKLKICSLIYKILILYFIFFSVGSAENICFQAKPLPRLKGNTYLNDLNSWDSKKLSAGMLEVSSLKSVLDFFPVQKKFIPFKKAFQQYSHKFSLGCDCKLRISKFPYYSTENSKEQDINHSLLAGCDDVFTAGLVTIFHDGKKLIKIELSNTTARYCPEYESLNLAKRVFIEKGIDKEKINLINHPSQSCIKIK